MNTDKHQLQVNAIRHKYSALNAHKPIFSILKFIFYNKSPSLASSRLLSKRN